MLDKIKVNSPNFYCSRINFKSNNNEIQAIDTETSNKNLSGMEALANYNSPFLTKSIKLNDTQRYRLNDKEDMTEIHNVQQRRDTDRDGLLTVYETLSSDVTRNIYPDLYEKNVNDLKEFAKLDGDEHVSDEEFVLWLESDEHGEVLDEYRVREANKILEKRKNK